MGEPKYKIGDRVRRTSSQPHFSNIPAGTLGTVIESNISRTVGVRWDVTFPVGGYYSASTLDCIEPASVQEFAWRPEDGGEERPGRAAPGPCIEHVTRATYENLKRDFAAMKEQRDRLRSELGDVKGERDGLRNRCHELETALAFAEREVQRLSKRGGR